MDQKTKKIFIISIVGLLLLAAITLVVFAINQRNERRQDEQYIGTSEVDPVSGEQISRSDRGHETPPYTITFLGLSQLLDRGLTMEQVTDTEAKFETIANKMEMDVEQISLYKDSVRRIMPENPGGKQRIDFKVQFNQTDDYNVTLTYDNISTVELTVYKDGGKTKYEA